MHGSIKPLALALLLAGCMPDFVRDTSAVHTATPVPFPYPGIYTGFASHGTLTYLIGADGRGRTCFRNQVGGRLFLGDLTYTGSRVHTEDGTFEVESVTAAELRLRAPHVKAALSKTETAPTVCREFFAK